MATSLLRNRCVTFFLVWLVSSSVLAKVPVTGRILAKQSGFHILIESHKQLNLTLHHLRHPDRWLWKIPKHLLITKLHHMKCSTIQRNCQAFRVASHGKFWHLVMQTTPHLQSKIMLHHVKQKAWYYDWTFVAKKRKNRHHKIAKSSISHHKVKLTTKPEKRARDIVVVIDPGHGGHDPGAIGRHRVLEKRVVLLLSKQLAKLLNAQPGYHAYLTRKNDHYLTLRQRLAKARHYHADCFIAVHADAFYQSQAHGASVFALSQRGASSEAAHWLAHQENNSELMGGAQLKIGSGLLNRFLLNLQQNVTAVASLKLGKEILTKLNHVAHLHSHKVERAAFVVLKSPDIVSLLIETGFVSNSHEARMLNQFSYRARLAQAIKLGIVKYFSLHPPNGTYVAQRQQGYYIHVRKGDTLYAIAKQHHVRVSALRKHNPGLNDRLKIGQRIFVLPTKSY